MSAVRSAPLPDMATGDDAGNPEAHAPSVRVDAISHLRAWITVLVVGHHAVLAYHPYAPQVPKSLVTSSRIWGAFPIVDSARWTGFSLFVSSNEMFFMALMFLLSGLFVWPSLVRKGAGGYLRDRALRLGVPFVVAAGVIAPLAYHFTYLQMGNAGGWAGFWRQWSTPGVWASGPAWFLWVLLAFDVVLAAVYAAAPRTGDALAGLVARLRSPGVAFAALALASAATLIVLELPVGGLSWWTWGPFAVQTSRVLQYFAYFVFGVGLGALGLERTVFAPGGALARQWKLWLGIASVAFVAATAAIIAAFSMKPLTLAVHLGADVAYAVSGAASSFAALALFLRFATRRGGVLGALAPCAYGMYLVHYPIVAAIQYALLPAPLPGFVKGVVVFAAAVSLSWGLVGLLRRIPGVARVI